VDLSPDRFDQSGFFFGIDMMRAKECHARPFKKPSAPCRAKDTFSSHIES
jgi:hypothetical protein